MGIHLENNLQNPKDKRKIICVAWNFPEPQKDNSQQHQEEAEEEGSNGEEMEQEFDSLKQELNEVSVCQEVDVENEEESHGVRSKKRRNQLFLAYVHTTIAYK